MTTTTLVFAFSSGCQVFLSSGFPRSYAGGAVGSGAVSGYSWRILLRPASLLIFFSGAPPPYLSFAAGPRPVESIQRFQRRRRRLLRRYYLRGAATVLRSPRHYSARVSTTTMVRRPRMLSAFPSREDFRPICTSLWTGFKLSRPPRLSSGPFPERIPTVFGFFHATASVVHGRPSSTARSHVHGRADATCSANRSDSHADLRAVVRACSRRLVTVRERGGQQRLVSAVVRRGVLGRHELRFVVPRVCRDSQFFFLYFPSATAARVALVAQPLPSLLSWFVAWFGGNNNNTVAKKPMYLYFMMQRVVLKAVIPWKPINS